ncbi:AAA family ATPase [Microbacterium sp. P05]|uniref:AAA family ATPase n=1 Tax=Microbacterium sp. P05 TaxID=3366948 RepID=UPI0037450F45
MKLHRLELAGFGPFRDRQVVDFDAFADDGIFLITGRTGSGKSSVLDGVTYALYGGVPRYESGDRRLRSDHCAPEDPTEVSLEFSAEGGRWRITRSPEYTRPKRRGDGFTTEPHRAVLERRDGDEWTGIAARPVDVAAHLDEILGLTQQQFLQVILLAQNRFARFLLARNDERQALLRTLFATRTYEQYADELETRRKAAEQALSSEGEGVRVLIEEAERIVAAADLAGGVGSGDGAPSPVDADPDPLTRIAALVRAVERAEYRVDTLTRERAEAEAAHTAAVESERAAQTLRRAQEERDAARRELAALDAAEPRIAADRAVLQLAERAEALRGLLDTVERAETAERIAVDAERDALTRWMLLGEDAVTAEALGAREDELAAALAACDAAATAEADLDTLTADRDRADATAAALVRERDELDERRAPVPAVLERVTAELAVVAGAPAALAAARATLADVERRLEAAREAATLADVVRDAERAVLRSNAEMQDAAALLAALLRQRLDGAAAELAATLVDGEACPVCGGADHPHPAEPTGLPVTDAEIDTAERAKDAAVEADRVASTAARSAREAHARLAARAGGEEVSSLEAAHERALVAVSAAEGDVETAARLASERDELDALVSAAALEHGRLTDEIARVHQQAALSAERANTAARGLDAVRAGFATVALRRADAATRRAAARALTDAAAERALRAQIRADAVADRAARLAESPFDTPADVRDALRPTSERSRLDERVREHDATLRAVRQRLLQLELDLVDAPEELVDLAGPPHGVATARDRFAAAVAALADAASTAERLRDLAQRADLGARGVADLAARHAVIARLAHTVAGRAPNTHRMTLETFVLAAELEEIVAAANLRLAEMSSGRYRLQHSDALAARGAASGLGLEVLDAFTGQPRPPQSLSGGESFLASLALALGLAEVVTARAGGLRLDTLFIDEGFGSLDEETLDLAMRTLDELRQGGRTVGVISHVAAMKEQVPAQLAIEATPQGPSVIRQDAALPV